MESKKGLSAIVATLLIILLTLIAVGIIWVVIRNVVESGAEQVDFGTRCIEVDLEAVAVNETSAGVYSVTLYRNAGGDDIGGVKVSVFNASLASSGPMDFGTINPLGQRTVSLNTSVTPATRVNNGNQVQFTAFFVDASGNEQACTQTGTFDF